MASKILLPDQSLFPVNKTITDINGKAITVSEEDAQKTQLGNAFLSVRAVTASCFAINNIEFNSVLPKPEWYDGLNEKFTRMKDHAGIWLNNYSIALTSTIPSSIIDFVPTYTACTDVITGIVQLNPNTLTPSQISTISSVLTRIIDKIDEISATVKKYVSLNDQEESVGKLIDWSKEVSSIQSELSAGNNTIQTASQSMSGQIAGLNAEIRKLQDDIGYYNKLVCTGAGLVGGGIFIGLVGGAVCLANPIAGGITIFIGVASLIAGATIWGIYQGKINASEKKIRADASQITEQNKTLVALNALSGSCMSVVENAKIATANLHDFATSWVVFGNILRQTLNALKSVDKDVQKSGLDVLIDMNTSKNCWLKVNEYAQQLLGAPKDIQTVGASEAYKFTRSVA